MPSGPMNYSALKAPTKNENVTDREIKNLSYPQSGLGETGLKSYIIFEVVKEKTLNPTTFIRNAFLKGVDLYNSFTDIQEDEVQSFGATFANSINDIVIDPAVTNTTAVVGNFSNTVQEEGTQQAVLNAAGNFGGALVRGVDGFIGGLNEGIDLAGARFEGLLEETRTTEFLTDADDLSYEEPETYPGSIKLYMPQFVFNDGVSYDNAELGILGAAAVSGSTGAMGDMFDAGVSLAKTSVADIMKGGENSGAAASLALQRLKSVPVLGELFVKNISATQAATRVKPSPNVRVLYNSTNLRTFSFSFNLIAASSSEAKEIEEIVKTFREELYPEAMVMKLGSVNTEVGLIFPNRFKLTLMYGDNPVFHKIKPCYLTSMNTAYNKSQSGMHYDGKPFEVDITLNFSESLALNRRDIEDGY